MTIGANVAIMAAAAAAQRRQRVLDVFRVAGATAPERAKSLGELGLPLDATLEGCIEAGVVRLGKREGELWLDEAAYVSRRDARPSRTAVRVVMAVLLAVLAIALGVMLAMRNVPA